MIHFWLYIHCSFLSHCSKRCPMDLNTQTCTGSICTCHFSALCVVLQVHLLSCFPSCDDLLVFAVKVPYTPWGEFWLWRTLVGYLVLSRRTCSTCPWRALRYHLLWQGIHFLHLKKQEAEKVKTANLRIDPFMSLPVCPKQRTSQSGPLLWSPSKDDKSMTFQSFRQLPRSPCYGAAWFAPWVHW